MVSQTPTACQPYFRLPIAVGLTGVLFKQTKIYIYRQADEVLFEHFKEGIETQKKGYEKVRRFCELANAAGHRYAWVDTCCIDKSSSAELSEAINSMFKWYRDSAVCYVYLEDIELNENQHQLSTDQLQDSRWTTRGWTLQELIAPKNVLFFSKDWEYCGNRRALSLPLHQATNIALPALDRQTDDNSYLACFSVAERMSWASTRTTTRPEDKAYCLLGIFNVHLPLLYGEGKRKAFLRLQDEIMKNSTDHSILAWEHASPNRPSIVGCLAKDPSHFRSARNIVTFQTSDGPFRMTNKGLEVQLPLIKHSDNDTCIAVLHNCRYKNDFCGVIGIELRRDSNYDTYYRWHRKPVVVTDQEWMSATRQTIYITPTKSKHDYVDTKSLCLWFQLDFPSEISEHIRERLSLRVPPVHYWDETSSVLRSSFATQREQRQATATLCYSTDDLHTPLLKMVFMANDQHASSLKYGIFKPAARPNPDRHRFTKSVNFRAGRGEFKLRVSLARIRESVKGERAFRVHLAFDMVRRSRLLSARQIAMMPTELSNAKPEKETPGIRAL